MIFAPNHGWIGMDLGAARTKVAQVRKIGGRLRLAASVLVPRRPPATGVVGPAGTELGGGTAGDVVRQLGGLAGSQTACVLPIGHTDLRTLALPASGDSERRALIAQEMQDLVDDFETRVFDYWVCPSAPPGGDGAVLEEVGVVSAARATVSRLTDELAAAQLRCEVIDGLPLALARAVQLIDGGPPPAPVAAVQWGYDSSVLTIVTGGRPAYTRHLRTGGFVRLVQPLTQTLDLTEAEAYTVLAETGLPQPAPGSPPPSELQEVLAELTSHPLHEFCDELRRTISFLKTQYPGLAARRMILMGDGAGLRNVEAHVQRLVGIGVTPWQMPATDDEHHQPHHQSPQLFAAAAALSALAFMPRAFSFVPLPLRNQT